MTGYITLEDLNNLEIEIETVTGPKLILVPKADYPTIGQGDIVKIDIVKMGD